VVLPVRFSNQNLVCISYFPMYATFPCPCHPQLNQNNI
jgi:hypothetical protein